LAALVISKDAQN